jgi:hypothetical protein
MKPSEHPWNKPALLRDVIEARNFVCHTVINAANNVAATVVSIAALYALDKLAEKHGDQWWIGLVYFAIIWGWYMYGRSKPSPELEASEKTARELYRPGEMFFE